MKVALIIIVSLWLISCKKDAAGPSRRLYRIESTPNAGYVFVTEFEYDAEGRIVVVKRAMNNDPLQKTMTITYDGNEVILTFTPFTDSLSTLYREIHLTLDNSGKLLKRIYRGNSVFLQPSSRYQASGDTMNFVYDGSGFLKTVTVRRFDSSWYAPANGSSNRRTFTNQYTTVDGKLTNVDQLGFETRIVTNNNVTIFNDTRTLEYHANFGYTKLYPNKYDCTNAAILNQEIGADGGSQYYFLIADDPLVDAQYKYMPDITQIRGKETEGNGNVAINFNGIVEVIRTYNADGMLATTETISPNPATKIVRYFYRK